jgi:phospholipase C
LGKKHSRVPRKAFVNLALLGLLAGCSVGPSAPDGRLDGFTPAVMPAKGNPVGSYIKHVVVIIQENRSFENFFAGYPGADAPTFGYADGKKIALRPTTFGGPDLPHLWQSSMTDWNHGKMDGFAEDEGRLKDGFPYAYSYVKHSLIVPYWTMAHEYVLADHMFPTEFGGSFTGHLTLVAGTDNLTPTKAEVNFPDGAFGDCDSPLGTKSSTINEKRQIGHFTGPFPCFNQFNTMAEVLDHPTTVHSRSASISWKYYADRRLHAGIWEPYEAIKYVRYGRDWWFNIVVPNKHVLRDVGDGRLADVSWVTPTEWDSDHPGSDSDLGPSWVASIVNAIGESQYWKSTAIVVVWDDWGGWYDNVKPPQLDFRGLGIRVPCLIISPYAKQGYVSHTEYEFGSILKFIEEAFDLPPLGTTSEGYTDTRATSIEDSFDFTQKPRRFKPIPALEGEQYFLNEPASDVPVDTE